MRTQSVETHIASPPTDAWEVMRDVVGWPRWTPSIRRVVPLEEPELAVGRRFRIVQPRLPAAVWTVTRLLPGRSFAWRTRRPGLALTAHHEIVPDAAGCRVALRLEFDGPMAGVVAWLTRGINRRYLCMEAEGLRSRCEHGPDVATPTFIPP